MRYTLALLLFTAIPAAGAEVPVGTKIAEFALRDYRGKEHRLADYAEAKLIVLAVLGTECPLAKLYAPRLQEISERYASRGVVVLGLNANAQDSVTEIAAHARQHELTFPVLKDLGNTVVDAVGATRTPEVIVLDRQHTIRYRGRIDERYGIGYVKTSGGSDYLGSAIESLLAGERVETASVEPVGCLIGRAKQPVTTAEVTYAGRVAAILNRRCVECHREGEIAPFPLTDYESAAGWAEMIAEVVREGRMPPWHAADPVSGTRSHDGATLSYVDHINFVNERRLSSDEREALLTWAAAGAPRGDGDAPPVSDDAIIDWQLPAEPDAVIPMSEEPFEVPAEGIIQYQHFRVDPKFDKDKWLRGAEVAPGNRAVVHHVLVFAREKGSREALGDGGRGFLAAYVPGLKAAVFPEGMAKLVPAGSELVFQIHYTPVGSPAADLTRLGLLFAEPDAVDQVVQTRNVMTRGLRIKPQEASQRFEAADAIPYDGAKLLAMMPHMHLRGQAFRYTLERGGERRTLLDVPRYDFNWQTGYRLVEPLPLQKGDRIIGDAWYDNSPSNLANPDPSANVRWGEQTWNEMMIGYYDLAVPLDEEAKKAVRSGKMPGEIRDRLTDRVGDHVSDVFDKYDDDGDGLLSLDEIPDQFRSLRKQLDRNLDGKLNAEELRPLFERRKR
jgi:peroxiredoxin